MVQRPPSSSTPRRSEEDKDGAQEERNPSPQKMVCRRPSLLDQIAAMQSSASTLVDDNANRAKEMEHSLSKAKRKSRELEVQMFGLFLNEMGSLRKAFDSVDASGDGFIETEELQAALKRAGKSMSAAECAKMIEKYDVDGNGKLDFEEFRLIFTGQSPPAFRCDKWEPAEAEESDAPEPKVAGIVPEGVVPEGTLKYMAETETFRYSFTPASGSRPSAAVPAA